MKKYVLILTFFTSGLAFAGLTDDWVQWEQLAQLYKEVSELQSQGRKLTSQIEGITSVKNTIDQKIRESQALMKGHYGFGSKQYGIPGLDRWNGVSKDWKTLVDGYKRDASDPLSKILKEVEQKYKLKSGSSYYKQKHLQEQAKAFDDLAKGAVAAQGVTTLAYNNVDEDIKALEKLRDEIERSDNQKQTLDLIARINIQAAIIEAKATRVNATKARLQATSMQSQVSDIKWAQNFLR